jgi:aromatic-L-amino-acid/L-tryptophan decarboxylase
MEEKQQISRSKAGANLDPAEFRKLGHWLIDRIAELYAGMDRRPLTTSATGVELEQMLKKEAWFLPAGQEPTTLVQKATDLVIDHSLYNGHPGFMGYVTASPTPLGALGDLLAAAVNPNVGGAALSPVATQIERQTIDWIGQLIGYPAGGGILVSGGNMANYVGFVAGMRARLGLEIRQRGIRSLGKMPLVYASTETHTWIHKAMDLFGLGTNQIRWIGTDTDGKMSMTLLEDKIKEDLGLGHQPMMVVGTAGSVSIGVVDSLQEIDRICRKYDLWFHIDGAYGGFAAAVPELREVFAGIELADSLAVDPHKWLYAPLEAGCTLIRDPKYLTDAFSYHPPYYQFGKTEINYVDYGPQNSRGFRALKVWLSLQHLGLEGYQQLIREDMALARYAFDLYEKDPDFETGTQYLSITTFRYIPERLRGRTDETSTAYLNDLNQLLLQKINTSGEYFVSNAVIQGKFMLRLCIVNFRTTSGVIERMPDFIRKLGIEVDTKLQKQ